MLSTGLPLIPFVKFRAWLELSLTKADHLAKVSGLYLERPGSLRVYELLTFCSLDMENDSLLFSHSTAASVSTLWIPFYDHDHEYMYL